MYEQGLLVFLPVVSLFILAGWGIVMKVSCKFRRPNEPFWPFAENPGLAIELADSIEFIDKVLGKADTDSKVDQTTNPGPANRESARRFQKLDFVFIVFYVLFFCSVPWVRSAWSRGLIVIVVLSLLVAIFDVLEDVQILRMLKGVERSSAKLFGQAKWFFYFATVAAEGSLFFFEGGPTPVRAAVGDAIGIALIAIAVGGIISSIKGSFAGISSATKLSAVGLIALAFTPLLMFYPNSLRSLAQYVMLMRVPLLLGTLLFALPFIAFFSSAKTLLRGLFDLTPLSLFVVAISALAVSGTACVISSLIFNNASARFNVPAPFNLRPSMLLWLSIMLLLALPAIGFSVWFSNQQKHGFRRLVIAALLGTGLVLIAAYILLSQGWDYLESTRPLPGLETYLLKTGSFSGYVQDLSKGDTRDPWPDHLFAFTAFLCTSILYAVVGIYGWLQLGKKRTVPALCSALMLLLILGWSLSALTFFFDLWHIPTLLIVAAVGFLTAQSHRSDHFYDLHERIGSAPDPVETITASDQRRVIIVAASGGGIQAGAWAAQVLYGLYKAFPNKFQKSLRMISSVSGGSVGNGFFVHWLANKSVARRPHQAAAMSSLDEVAWGLAWPDFLRALFPWLFGELMDRGRALERAWLLNSTPDPKVPGKMDDPLSSWNKKAAAGEIPAVVMNGTIAETGERLLLATTRLRSRLNGGALMDATELHTINGQQLDVGVVTAARLSATFPYVTPAARSTGPRPQPHVVDGGYYDNYGMATLVEWLDEALEKAGDKIESVLVIQIHGAPVDSDFGDERLAKTRGWFYQAFVPLTTLLSVRTAGQVAHNDIELKLMQQKWSAAGVPIHTVTFEFRNPDVPLSWHLTRREVEEIRSAWRKDMVKCKRKVREFLEGNDDLECGCIRCKSVSAESQNGSNVVMKPSTVRSEAEV